MNESINHIISIHNVNIAQLMFIFFSPMKSNSQWHSKVSKHNQTLIVISYQLSGASTVKRAGAVCAWWKKWGRKMNRCTFSLHFVHSHHAQAHFFSYKFTIFVQSNDSSRGDWWLFPQNNCQARQTLAFWEMGQAVWQGGGGRSHCQYW